MARQILIVATSHDKLGDTKETTGCWAEEIMTPIHLFKEAGYAVTVASIKGGEIPMDEASLNAPFLTPVVEKMLLDDEAMKLILESQTLEGLKADNFEAVYLPGGHGTCWDFPDNAGLISLVEAFAAQGKVIGAVCHGPMGLVNVKGPDGKPLVAGKKVTCFTDAEEYAVVKEKIVPFLLQARLKELGCEFSNAANWTEYAVTDGKLVTGQNPQSSHKVAELMLKALTASP